MKNHGAFGMRCETRKQHIIRISVGVIGNIIVLELIVLAIVLFLKYGR